MQCLTFRLNGVEYAVDVNIVETVVEHVDITAVPTSIAYLCGVMNLRGRVIPVMDLRRKFGMPPAPGTIVSSMIVFNVAGHSGKALAIAALVDDVSEVLAIEDVLIEAAATAGPSLWEPYVRGIVRLDERMIVILEVEGLFSLREIDALGAA
jgi:purine-binding chemotaxis protein CheW